MEPLREFERLRDAYDRSFQLLVIAMNAHGDVEQASARYRQSRDELARFLLERREIHATLTAA